jgi:hypothetical protein
MGRGLGVWLVVAGLGLVGVGLLVLLLGWLGLPLGRLPGDLSYKGKNVSVFVPLGTCLLLSLVVSLVMWVVSKWGR